MTPQQRFQITLELLEFSEFQAKRRFLEQNPTASEADIENYMSEWYCNKPLKEYEEVQIRENHEF